MIDDLIDMLMDSPWAFFALGFIGGACGTAAGIMLWAFSVVT